MSSSGLTRAGQFLGTPDYAAPEQISGQTVDGRADQYALACVAYTLLSGSVLFRREVPMAVLYAHLSVPPPRLTTVRPDLPDAVNQVLARALAKEPDDRYDSCGAFADALREALGLEPYDSSGGPWAAQAWVARPGQVPTRRRSLAVGRRRSPDPPAGTRPRPSCSPDRCSFPLDGEPAVAAAGFAAPAGRGGDLDRRGGRGPCLLRQRAGGQRQDAASIGSPPSSPNGGSGSPAPRSASGGAACPAASSRRST